MNLSYGHFAIASFLAMQLAAGLGVARAAVNVLECKTSTGETFVLRSDFKRRLIPALTPHNAPEYDRRPWQARYFDAKGKEHSAGLKAYTVHAGANELRNLQAYCAHFGIVRGVPQGPGIYLSRSGQWQGWYELRDRLNPLMATAAIDEALKNGIPAQQGYRMTGRELVVELNGELIDEVSLHLVNQSGELTNPVAAVYQSRSTDGGLHWTSPIVTRESLLFEVDRSVLESCIVARPTRFNGEPLAASWPVACTPVLANSAR